MNLTRGQYQQLVDRAYTHIPLSVKVETDSLPVDIYMKLAAGKMSYLLESAGADTEWGRYSFIGLECREYIFVSNKSVTLHRNGRDETRTVDDPLVWIEEYIATFRVPPVASLPRFSGGFVGYFGYETIQFIEPKLAVNSLPDMLGTPDIFLFISDRVAVFDNVRNELSLIVYADASRADAYELACEELKHMCSELRKKVPLLPAVESVPDEKDFVSGFGESEYMKSAEVCRKYITDGEAMQIVLSQRMQAPFRCAPFKLYRALLQLNPSPYMYYFDFGDFQVVGSSPEILVRLQARELTLRPIAGTRRRGATVQEDLALEQELLADKKELAEHLMLIDLGRNDLGRIAQIGSVRVTEKMMVERYSHVMHMVSNVTGRKCDDVGLLEVLRATFPAGTVSGAPKVRAMEIIAMLEPIKRNIYSGAVGYIGWDGTIDTAIAIRTAVIKDETLFVQTGAGLVYDSNPAHEWMETINKARVLFKAAEMAGTVPQV